MRNKTGFTLIEIMVSLTLVGLIATIAGSSVIMGAKAYLFARENDVMTQKAQLAMNRISREFIELSDIKAADGSCIVYESPNGRRAIAKVDGDGAVRLFTNFANTTCPASGGDILIDNVQSLALMYNPDPVNIGNSLWSKARNDDIRNLYAIKFQIILLRANASQVSFETTVSPRNNGNAGGAPIPTVAYPPPDYAGKSCFIATAAYGDADHPFVAVLRDFRDAVLMDSEAGRAFVRYYYLYGPFLAEAIDENRPACFAVRLLLAPVASLAFFLLYCPFALPVVLFVAWVMARFIIKICTKPFFRRVHFLRPQGGAILVTLIAAMVVFSSLGAILLSLFSSSALSQVAGNNTMRAYYLAESGFRYAASRYVNAVDEAARNTALVSLHDKDFTLLQNDGKFRLKVYPYYYVVTSVTANEIVAEVKGGATFTNASQFKRASWIQISKAGVVTQKAQIDGADPTAPPVVRFYCLVGNSCPWNPAVIEPDSIITPACRPDQAQLTITDLDNDGLPDLAFQANSGADIFPPLNGIITVNTSSGSRTLAYRSREYDPGRNLYYFKSVTDPNGGKVQDLGVSGAAWDNIVAGKFLRLESTGTVGSAANPVTRKIEYFVPIGISGSAAGGKTRFIENFDDLSRWYTGTDPSHVGTQIPVDSSLHFTGGELQVLSQAGLPQYLESQIALNWTAAGLALFNEWLRAGNFLSYDVQVKLAVDPPPSPNIYAPGISFRIDGNRNNMGFSLASTEPGLNTNGTDKDSIPDTMTGSIEAFRPAFLLWMKEYNNTKIEQYIGQCNCANGVQITYVQYRINDNFSFPPSNPQQGERVISDDPTASWTTGDRVRFQCAPVTPYCILPNVRTGGQLQENRDYYIRLGLSTQGARAIYLFDTYANATMNIPPYGWSGLVDLIDSGSGVFEMMGQNASFKKLAHQYVTFSGTDRYNILEGNTIPKAWTTLLVRIVEAPSVSFVSGGGAGKNPLRGGDTVYQTSNNLPDGTVQAIARVRVDPVYREAMASSTRDSKWSGGTADGILILDVLKESGVVRPYTFTAGAKLFVETSAGGVQIATVGIPASLPGSNDVVFRARSNWISTYVGANRQDNSPDNNPFNNYRGGISRQQVFWPPDDITATAPVNDKYTVIRFEDYVNSTYCTSFWSKGNSGSGGDFIRMQSPDGVKFYSPATLWDSTRPEVGLNAYGLFIPSIYFDQFALQYGPVENSSRQSFVMPIQR